MEKTIKTLESVGRMYTKTICAFVGCAFVADFYFILCALSCFGDFL